MNLKLTGALSLLVVGFAAPSDTVAHPWHNHKKVDHGPTFENVSDELDWERVDDPDTGHLGGAAWLDYDDDGDLDLFLANAPGGTTRCFAMTTARLSM